MAFSGISAYEQNIRNVESADPSASSGIKQVSAVRAANAAALGDAKEGQVVTGEVSQINGRTVKLTLPDSQVVTARLQADVKISVGESMAFTVKSNSGSQIELKPLFNSSAVNATAIKALGQASIMVDSGTLSMASAMMEAGMAIDKLSMQAMFRQVNRFPQADPADIVSMTKQGLPLDADTVEQYTAYKNNEHQLMAMAEDLSESVSDMAQELGGDGALELAGIFNGDDTAEELAGMKAALTEMSHEFEASLIKADTEEPRQKPSGILDVAVKNVPEPEPVANAPEPVMNPVESETPLGLLLSGEDRLELAQGLTKLGMGEEAAARLINGEMSPGEALKYMQSAMKLEQDGFLDSVRLPEDEKNAAHSFVKNMPSSKAFKALLGDALIKEMTLENDGDISHEKVNRLYERILKNTGRVSELLEQFGKGDSPLAKQLSGINQNINFMNQLNETFSYVQLPVRMSEENAHGDLYVYTNKKKLAEKDGEVTALLHLEMAALGTMDIHVTLRDENTVKTHFMLENDEMLDFVESNIHILDERLKDRGYNMTSQASLKDKDGAKNPAIQAMLGGRGSENQGRMISKFSFDVKA